MSKLPKLILGDGEAGSRSHAAPWQVTPGTVISGRAFIDEADVVAVAMEAKWGVGRLRLLVGASLCEKFDRQRYLFNHAIWHGDLEEVRTQSARMINAWRALDATATQEGHQGPAAEAWEVALEDGSVAVLCRSEADAGAIRADGRNLRVYTLDEVARLLSGFPTLARIKEQFPGAAVTDVRSMPSDPLLDIHDTSGGLDDPMPY